MTLAIVLAVAHIACTVLPSPGSIHVTYTRVPGGVMAEYE